MTATWMTENLSRSAVAEYLRIDWKTVGRCISRARKHIEPDPSKRPDNLVNIGIDETSYRKGHKYITVIVNHDTNTIRLKISNARIESTNNKIKLIIRRALNFLLEFCYNLFSAY